MSVYHSQGQQSAELVQQGGGLFDDKGTPTDVNL